MIKGQDSVVSRLNTLEVVFTLLIHTLRAVSGVFSVLAKTHGCTFGLDHHQKYALSRQVDDVAKAYNAITNLQSLAEGAIARIGRARDESLGDVEPITEEKPPDTVQSARLAGMKKARIAVHCNACGTSGTKKRKTAPDGAVFASVNGCTRCCSRKVAKVHWNERIFIGHDGNQIEGEET